MTDVLSVALVLPFIVANLENQEYTKMWTWPVVGSVVLIYGSPQTNMYAFGKSAF
tara:strand:- start:561 stop:725 length:165 start_codon:yes stop_codon:yes gene_type:complete